MRLPAQCYKGYSLLGQTGQFSETRLSEEVRACVCSWDQSRGAVRTGRCVFSSLLVGVSFPLNLFYAFLEMILQSNSFIFSIAYSHFHLVPHKCYDF